MHKYRTTKAIESPSDRAVRRTATATVWMAIFSFALLLVTGGTLLVLKRQLWEMHEGGVDTHALVTQRRAWVGLGDAAFVINAASLTVQFTAVNVGESPATNVFYNVAWAGRNKGESFAKRDIVYPNSDQFQGTAFPHQQFKICNRLPDPVPLFQATYVEQLKSGDKILYVFAKIEYKDIFDRPHFTHYCVSVDRDLKTSHPCAIYNDSDSDSDLQHGQGQ